MKQFILIFILLFTVIFINAFSVYIVKSGDYDNEDEFIKYIKNRARFDYIIYDLSNTDLELSSIIGNIMLNNPDAIVLIGDKAINMVGTHIKDVPIVVTMFNSICDTLKNSKMVCGINYNFIKENLVKYIKNKFPEIKKMGVIFKVENSLEYARHIKKIFEKDSIFIEFANINTPDDFTLAVKMLKASSIDMLWLGNDPIILDKNNFKKLNEILIKENIPVLSINGLFLKQGVFASIMFDLKNTAINTGDILIRLNNGELPSEIGFINPEQFKIALNKNLLKKFNIRMNINK